MRDITIEVWKVNTVVPLVLLSKQEHKASLIHSLISRAYGTYWKLFEYIKVIMTHYQWLDNNVSTIFSPPVVLHVKKENAPNKRQIDILVYFYSKTILKEAIVWLFSQIFCSYGIIL